MPENLVAQLSRRYRKHYPDLKFLVRTAKVDGAFATTHLRDTDGTFIITFAPYLDQPLRCFLLAHEIAHGISWNMDDEHHGQGFWRAYEKTYAIYEDFCKDTHN